MKINIVCSEAAGGWIYSKFIEEFKKHSKHEIVVNYGGEADICHALPYYEPLPPKAKFKTAWLSHQEDRTDLNKKFVQVAKAVDVGISHSKKYAAVLRDQYHCNNIVSVLPGVDLDVFTRRDTVIPANGKMVVGYIGRQYTSSNRKNPTLLDKISKLPFVDFRTTGGKLKADQVPGFYRSLDVTISPATIEGGPLAVQESLACGVPIIVMKDVGVASEFKDGVIKAESDLDFIARLKDMYLSKQHLTHWRSPSVMNRLRSQVKEQTWKKFVEEHDRVWDMITANNWRKSKE